MNVHQISSSFANILAGAVIQKESAAIRTTFREEPSGSARQQNVLKLLYSSQVRVDFLYEDTFSPLEKGLILVKLNVSSCSRPIGLQINDSVT